MNNRKNIGYNILYTMFNMALPMITMPYLAHVIGAEGVGTFSFYLSIAQFAVLISKLGIPNYGAREIARSKQSVEKLSNLFFELWILQIITTAITSVLYLAYLVTFQSELDKTATIFYIWIICSFLDIDWFWQGMLEFKRITIRNTIIRLVMLCAIFLFVKSRDDVWKYAAITVIANVFAYVSIWFGIKKILIRPHFIISEFVKHIKPCAFLLLPVMAAFIFRSMDKVLLGIISGMAETGIYENGEKFIYCLTGVITAIGSVMLPSTSEMIQAGREKETENTMLFSQTAMTVFTSAAAFGLIAVADLCVPVLLGNEFQKSAKVLSMIAPTLIMIGWANTVKTQYIIPRRKDEIFVYGMVIGIVLNLLIDITLIPRYGALGACVGTIVAEASVPTYQFVRLRREISYSVMIGQSIPYFLIGLIMLVILSFVKQSLTVNMISLAVIVLLGIGIYVGLVALYVHFFDKKIKEYLF